MFDLSTYELETLGTDEHFVVSRGISSSGGPSVLLVSHAPGEPSLAAIDRIRRSHSIRAELDSEWAATPLGLAQLAGREALVLADPGGVVLARLLGKPLEIEAALRIAISLAHGIGRLHARGLIHRDIKPAHIMVVPETGRTWIAGTGLSLRLTRQKQAPEPPVAIAGTLAYMAPEQTGRMNRSIDARSDLYTFGVIVYQMLTGELPFASTDAMELVHCHVARQPVPPARRVEGIPAALSAIVEKLLAKTAEDRYQTARGVETDLQRCLDELRQTGTITPFTLGAHDVSDRLMVPERLYGREQEIQALLSTFERVTRNGTLEVTMVSGYSGIGKSSVVSELLKELVPRRGLFASGKFDQYQRDVPFATVAQAFRSLIRGILTESQTSLQAWRADILAALGTNAQRMIDLIPELELVIGKQPAVPELPPKDAATLFQTLFRNFTAVFARAEHPLVLFLDDLQWLDAATLELLENLSVDPELLHLHLVGAYRDNEVGAEHPLTLRLESMRKAGARINEVALAPLRLDDVARLTADALHCDASRAMPLARLMYEKTGGNPFFTIQFLSALEDEGLVWFDRDTHGWCWDLERIHEKKLSDNVVDLMLEKIRRLPDSTRTTLHQLACLGTSASASTLTLVAGEGAPDVVDALEHAIQAGLVHRSQATFTFLHDRIREAAYALVTEDERPSIHLRIGRTLLAATPVSERVERAFDLANQLNRGAALLETREERRALCELNLVAAQRARAATAYASALSYLVVSESLLEPGVDDYELSSSIALHRAECEFLTGDVATARGRLEALANTARTQVERARVAGELMMLFTAIDDYPKAIEIGLAYLRTIGVEWSATPTQEEVGAALGRIPVLLAGRSIASIVDLPPLTDASILATIDVLTALAAPALFTNGALYALCVAQQVNLSLEHGNCDASAIAYALAGMVFGAHLGDYQTAEQFALLAQKLVDEKGLTRFEARVFMVVGHHVFAWVRDLGLARALTQRGLDAALRTGDVVYGAYTIAHLISNDFAAGRPLSQLEKDCRHGMEFARKGRFMGMFPAFVSQLSFVRALRGLPPDFDVFGDEEKFAAFLASDYRLAVAGCGFWTMRQQIRLTLLDHAGAVDAEERAKPLLWAAMSFFERAEYHYYGAIARAARHDEVPEAERAAHVEALRAHHAQMAIWAKTAPMTFDNRERLAAAEIARIEGRELDAQRLYEEAIKSARRHDFVHNEALALERAAHFYAQRGFDAIAMTYLRSSRQCYVRYGAEAKVRQMDAMHPRLAAERSPLASTSTIDAPAEQLDVATVLKVSEAVFGEIVLEKLMHTLMVTAVEHAGAERALLVLARSEELQIEAEARTAETSVEVRLRRAPVASLELPEGLLQYVVRTLETVVIEDASASSTYAADPYFAANSCRSILCLPLVKQTKLVGALYLENNLATHVFTPARIAVLRLLAAQAASALDNARLYEQVLRMHDELAHVTRVVTLGEMAASIAHEVNQPLASMGANAGACVRWLDRPVPDLTEAKDAARRVSRDAKRASEIVSRLRSLFRKSETTKEPHDVNKIVADVLLFTDNEMHRSNVVARTKLTEGLPMILGDRVQLQQVLLNLVLNASEAMRTVDDRARELTIVTALDGEGRVLVSVEDSGPGFDPSAKDKVFDAFHTTKSGGMGMGLSISRSIIEDHGGRIWARLNEGAPGASFHFTLEAAR